MLNIARRLNPKGAFVLGKGTTLPFKSGSFDIVVCFGNSLATLSSATIRNETLMEMHRVLDDNGTLILSFLNRYPMNLKIISRLAGALLRWFQKKDPGYNLLFKLGSRRDKSSLLFFN